MADVLENNPEYNYQTKAKIFVVIENFLAKEAYSGLALFVAAAIALIWANSPWAASYFDLWHTPVGIEIG